jgi:8-oxo-dGTP diphosphatase
MVIKFYEASQIENSVLKYAIIITNYMGKYVLVRHKDRDTFEFPAGHRDPGEKIFNTAKRELFEETGALDYTLEYVADYSIEENGETGFGGLFYADISFLGELPDYEIVERLVVEQLPEILTYPIQVKFLKWVEEKFKGKGRYGEKRDNEGV